MMFDDEVDARGLRCPLPVLKARKRLLAMAPGQVLRLVTTDPAAWVDVPHYCSEAGHALVWSGEEQRDAVFLIRHSG